MMRKKNITRGLCSAISLMMLVGNFSMTGGEVKITQNVKSNTLKGEKYEESKV